MKQKNLKKGVVAKGDRLNWTPLKDVKSVRLTSSLTKGRLLTARDLSKARRSKNVSLNVLVP